MLKPFPRLKPGSKFKKIISQRPFNLEKYELTMRSIKKIDVNWNYLIYLMHIFILFCLILYDRHKIFPLWSWKTRKSSAKFSRSRKFMKFTRRPFSRFWSVNFTLVFKSWNKIQLLKLNFNLLKLFIKIF